MAYLYLNFLDNLDKGLGDKAWGRNDFFTQSLNEQYEALKRKLGARHSSRIYRIHVSVYA